MTESYRQHFKDPAKANQYESEIYGHSSYSTIIWSVEQHQLEAVLAEFRKTHDRIEYLDFAMGTGRISAFMQDKVDALTGIDVSEEMMAVARGRVHRGNLICRDITNPSTPIEGQYDLITAFRFVLNAEPALRLAGLKALAKRLRDRTSRLIVNNHANLLSHKMALWPIHKLRYRGQQREANYLTRGQMNRLFLEAGLEVERTFGSGVLSARAARMFSQDRAIQFERWASGSPLSYFGSHQLYVTRLAH